MKWVFKNKVKYKALLLAKVINQIRGINFEEIFALVARLEDI